MNDFFEWDSEKDKANQKKHKLSFEESIKVFADPNKVELFDDLHSTEKEDRYICIGLVQMVICVVFVIKEPKIRIVSARKATHREVQIYYDYNKNLGRH